MRVADTVLSNQAKQVTLRKWSVTIILELSKGPMRFSQLTKNLKISNKVLSEKLSSLMNEGLVSKMIDYEGEYYLTSYGETVASLFKPLISAGIKPSEVDDVLRCKWMSYILKSLVRKERFANELFISLKTISWKVLSERLKKLEKYQLVHREVINSYPARTKYFLTEKGKILALWIINNENFLKQYYVLV